MNIKNTKNEKFVLQVIRIKISYDEVKYKINKKRTCKSKVKTFGYTFRILKTNNTF